MEDTNTCDNVCLCICEGSSFLLRGLGAPLEREFVVSFLSLTFLGVDPPPKRRFMAGVT